MTKHSKMRAKKARAKYLKDLRERQTVRSTGFDYDLAAKGSPEQFKDHGKYYFPAQITDV